MEEELRLRVSLQTPLDRGSLEHHAIHNEQQLLDEGVVDPVWAAEGLESRGLASLVR